MKWKDFVGIISFLFILFPTNVSAANPNQPTEEWVRLYDGGFNDFAKTLAVDSSGNIYITGSSYNSSGDWHYGTVKYDTNGNELWARIYDGNRLNQAIDLAVDSAGNVYVTGAGFEYIAGEWYSDYVTVKYDANGNQLWVKSYDNGANDGAAAIAVDLSGNVYVTGGVSDNYATIKYDANGNELWVKIYGGGSAKAIAVDSLGNVYVTGSNNGGYATLKYDTYGNELWVNSYGGPGDYATAIALDSSDNVYVTGWSQNSDGNYDYATIKYDNNGNEQWVKRYDSNSTDYARAIAVDPLGNVYVTGESGDVEDIHAQDYATIKYDTNGNELWVRNYHYKSGDIARALTVDSSGNVYVTGQSNNRDGRSEYATIKYKTDGKKLWVMRYGSGYSYGSAAWDIALDVSGNVFVTGNSYKSDNTSDYATIKYNQNP